MKLYIHALDPSALLQSHLCAMLLEKIELDLTSYVSEP